MANAKIYRKHSDVRQSRGHSDILKLSIPFVEISRAIRDDIN